MYLQGACAVVFLTLSSVLSQSTQGIQDLVKRRLPNHVDFFTFQLKGDQGVPVTSSTSTPNDEYVVSTTPAGKIRIEGNTPIALATGLHRYLKDVVHVDIWWAIGSRLDTGPKELPLLKSPLFGSSIVPWRYHFNPVTFSCTTAFWNWEDWELELDWLALRGVNLPLAWVGQEKILVEVFREIGLADGDINSFLGGPAFQAWNRMGNIQGSWDGDLPREWIDGQFELQKNITKRMVDLGMTPILPCYAGWVPRGFTAAFPNASVVRGSTWQRFPAEFSNVSFLEPQDPLFVRMQKSFIFKQSEALGNITHFYTLDQYNENDPVSGELDYLEKISRGTWSSLKAADPNAIWVMQGWLFSKNPTFWTNDRVRAYLGGIKNHGDALILDLFSESKPQWNRLGSGYFGKPWIWCQLHNYGGNMGLYGQIMNITINPIEALANSPSLVGLGLSMEGQQGNEIVYDLLLDQAWSKTPIETESYFRDWVSRRYSATDKDVPEELYQAWEIMRTTVYNNTNLTSESVSKSVIELSPSIHGLVGRIGHHPTTIHYDPLVLLDVWDLLYDASKGYNDWLWENPAYSYDMTDVTRQVLSNGFLEEYLEMVETWKSTGPRGIHSLKAGKKLDEIIVTLDILLSANPAFSLSTWIGAARSHSQNSTLAKLYEDNALNQITCWGPNGEINDYASKAWGRLVGSYYGQRWSTFTRCLSETEVRDYDETDFLDWELRGKRGLDKVPQSLESVLEMAVLKLPDLFAKGLNKRKID